MKRMLLFLGMLICSMPSFSQTDLFDMRMIYHEPGMDSVNFVDFDYQDTLKAYLFKPQKWKMNDEFPCVIFTSAFETLNKPIKAMFLKDWAKLLASRGIIAVIYDVSTPIENFDQLIEYLNHNKKELKINKEKLALWSFSGHTPLGISKINKMPQFNCHIIYYGIAVTADSKYLKQVEDISKQFGFTYQIDSGYASNVPNFIIRAGKDKWEIVQLTTDEFINELLEKNIPFELINYSQGRHTFDVFDNNEESEYIILRTIEYLERQFKR